MVSGKRTLPYQVQWLVREGGPQVQFVLREEGLGTVVACIGMIRKGDVLAQWALCQHGGCWRKGL